MLPTVTQSLDLMHQIAEELFSRGLQGIECNFIYRGEENAVQKLFDHTMYMQYMCIC
jgi:hypothetical protein